MPKLKKAEKTEETLDPTIDATRYIIEVQEAQLDNYLTAAHLNSKTVVRGHKNVQSITASPIGLTIFFTNARPICVSYHRVDHFIPLAEHLDYEEQAGKVKNQKAA